MPLVILFSNPNGRAAVVYHRNAEITQEELVEFASQAVPTGEPWWIIDSTQLPDDGMYRNAWRVNVDNGVLGSPPVVLDPVIVAQLDYEAATLVENTWRDAELLVIATQLDALEEAEAGEVPEDLLPGTRTQWLSYRGKVRNWVEGKGDYPDITKRPVRPS